MVSQCAREVQKCFEEAMKATKLDQLLAPKEDEVYE